MFDEILLPTAGTRQVANVVETALELAAQCDARLHVLFVVDADEAMLVPAGSRQLYVEGETATSEVAELATYREVDAVTEVREGRPREVVLDYVRDHDVDLVVVGLDSPHSVRGYLASRLGYALLDDLPDHLIRRAPVPVVSVRI